MEVDKVVNKLLKAMGVPIEMKEPNKAMFDRRVVREILVQWERDITRKFKERGS
jgi:hypothetical protein|tara:strand:+ start:5045 stop:5206 length:162 start_codon:yes stop_codon:yes gene_type:complete